MSSNTIEISIRDAKQSMTRKERMIAEYMESCQDSIASLSLKELAALTKTSEASIVRFCKTLGFRGYRDFALKLSEEMGSRKSSLSANEYTDIRPGDDTKTIVKSVCMTNIRSISDTQAVLNMQSVDRLVEMLRTSDRIFFFGMGASGLVCMDACQKFMRINKKAWYMTDSHTMRQTASLLTPDDMAIFISYSGTTAEIVSALDIALKTGTKTAAITKYSKGNIAAKTDVALYISSPEVTIRSGAMGSRIAMLNVIDIIFSVMASAEYDRIRQYLDNTHEALQ